MSTTIIYQEPLKIVGDILIEEMELPGRVLATNQKFILPTDGVFIVVSYVGPSKVIASSNEVEDDGADGLTEVQTVNMQHMIQIDIFAFNDAAGGNQARARKEEIAMALRSIYSQQQQELYSMQISRNTGLFMDTSSLEATEMLTRYTTTIQTVSAIQKRKAVDSYNAFGAEFITDPKAGKQPVLAPPVSVG